jgi:hypothetical protein
MLMASEIILTMDARVALLLFLVLLLAAATPIVLGWMALLPDEREPFTRPGEIPAKKVRDGFAIFLLANISATVLLRVPGFDGRPLSSKIVELLPPDWTDDRLMIVFTWFGFIPVLAVAYTLVRPNPIRPYLLVGGVLTLVLWFAGPRLLGAIVGAQ